MYGAQHFNFSKFLGPPIVSDCFLFAIWLLRSSEIPKYIWAPHPNLASCWGPPPLVWDVWPPRRCPQPDHWRLGLSHTNTNKYTHMHTHIYTYNTHARLHTHKNINQHTHRPQSLKPDIIVSSELTQLTFNVYDAPFHPLNLQYNAKKLVKICI